MIKTPSRILNEKANFLGLETFDFVFLGYFLIFTHEILSLIHLGLFAIPLSLIVFFFLMSLRLKYRPKTLRDFFLFHLQKSIK